MDWIPERGELLDVGSGGGFPAIPIALARPRLTVTMVEASSRKSAFLRRVSRETNLTNVQVLNDRVEMLGAACHGYFDLITARAVADVRDLIKWTRKFLAPGGRWLFWKGRDWQKEGNLARLKIQLVEERVLSDGGRLLWLAPKPAKTSLPRRRALPRGIHRPMAQQDRAGCLGKRYITRARAAAYIIRIETVTKAVFEELQALTTEARNPNTLGLDTMSVREILEAMNREDRSPCRKVSPRQSRQSSRR